MERLNWSSIVRSIQATRSGKALFFKPVCVIAAIDATGEAQSSTSDIDAKNVLSRFSDYVTPFHPDRGNDGYQPLWHLSNNRLWTFYKGDEALTTKEFSDGKPGTRKRLFERFDRLAIHEEVERLWASPVDRRALRDHMLLMLHEGDGDSRLLVQPLFDPQSLLNRDQWPSQERLKAYFAHLRQPLLFDDTELKSHLQKEPDERPRAATVEAGDRPRLTPAPIAIENVPSSIDYVWASNRIAVGPNLASLPSFPIASSRRDHGNRLEACAVQTKDLLRDLDRRKWQIREEYRLQIERYIERLPQGPGTGNILLADAAIRILRDMFAAEQVILPAPFAAGLRALLQQHTALRPFYPELDSFYRAVRTGRIEECLPLDAVESIIDVVREQTPTIFDDSVSAAIVETSAPEPVVGPMAAEGARGSELISPPPDPLGELDPAKAHDLQVAGALNRLWKVFTSADKVHSSTSAWIKTYNELSDPISQIIKWLRSIF